jgi:menaquinone-dependent protoporphyrinogen IX oxidase
MKQVAIIYASSQGSTAEVARYYHSILKTHRVSSKLYSAEQALQVGYIKADAYLLGSPIHGGHIMPTMARFIQQGRYFLEKAPVNFWINCMRVQEPMSGRSISDHYMTLNPELHSLNIRNFGVFGGKLNLDKLTPQARWGMVLQYDGQADCKSLEGDHRNWDAMSGWMTKIVSDLYYGQGVTVR